METAPRIAIFLPSLNGGGAERAMILFAQTIQQMGCSVEIICAEKKGHLTALVDSRFPVVDLGAPRMARAIISLRRYLLEKKPDVVYSTIVHSNLALLIASIGLKKKVKIVIRESNTPLSEQKRTLSRYISHVLAGHLYRYAHVIIAVSSTVSEQLLQINPALRKNLKVLDTPVVPINFVAQAAEEPGHPWFAPGQPPVILGVGRLHPQKNFALLIRAFSEVRKTKECRLMILGQGALLEELKALAGELGVAEDVSFAGFTLNPFSYMGRARVFVLSSNCEGMPNVLIQAMALGTPVISTDCPGGSADCLKNGEYGALVPVNDTARLAQAIRDALDAPRRDDVAEFTRRRFGAESASRKYLAAAGVVFGRSDQPVETHAV